MDVWGWITPVASLFSKGVANRARRARLRTMLVNPKFPDGRSLDALRRCVGEVDTDDGRERTRELLRDVKDGVRRARALRRSSSAEEMWGLRAPDED